MGKVIKWLAILVTVVSVAGAIYAWKGHRASSENGLKLVAATVRSPRRPLPSVRSNHGRGSR